LMLSAEKGHGLVVNMLLEANALYDMKDKVN
jgi:hypothetical protein